MWSRGPEAQASVGFRGLQMSASRHSASSHARMEASRAPRSGRRIVVADGAGLRERGAFRLKVDDGVAVGGLDARVAEPVADGDEVDAGLEAMDGRAVTHRMRVHTLVGKARRGGVCKRRILPQEVAEPKPCQGLSAAIAEEPFRGRPIEPRLPEEQHGGIIEAPHRSIRLTIDGAAPLINSTLVSQCH